MPTYLRDRMQLTRGAEGRVSVRVRLPLLLKRWRTPLRVGATAAMERQ